MSRPITIADGLAHRLAMADYSRRHPRRPIDQAAAVYAGRLWPLFLREATAEVERFRSGLPCPHADYLRLLEAKP